MERNFVRNHLYLSEHRKEKSCLIPSQTSYLIAKIYYRMRVNIWNLMTTKLPDLLQWEDTSHSRELGLSLPQCEELNAILLCVLMLWCLRWYFYPSKFDLKTNWTMSRIYFMSPSEVQQISVMSHGERFKSYLEKILKNEEES